MNYTICIVEDNKIFAEAFIKLIEAFPEFKLQKHFDNAEEAEFGLEVWQPQICVLDINLPGMTGLELLKKIKTKLPQTQFIMCSTFEDEDNIFQALKLGATGYFSKNDTPINIINALKDFINGGAPMSPVIANKVIKNFNQWQVNQSDKIQRLTPRELELLELLASGLLYKEIANQLNISIDTVKGTCSRVYKKLEVNNKVEAINLL